MFIIKLGIRINRRVRESESAALRITDESPDIDIVFVTSKNYDAENNCIVHLFTTKTENSLDN